MVVGILVLKDPESIKKKIISYSHQEFNKEEFTNIESIKNKIKLGVDLFERKIDYKIVNIDETFPDYIVNNKKCLKIGFYNFGAPDRSRTHNLRSRNPALYPVEATGAIWII